MAKADQPPPIEEQDQIFLIDKPLTWTSFDVVKKIKFAGQFKKVGHAGTLDPLATGLLVVCTGKFTKTIDTIQNATKEYVAQITFGYSTPSFDAETEPSGHAPTDQINVQVINKALCEHFIGTIQQTPPAYSAILIDGQRAYTAARKGKEVKMKSREISIYNSELMDFFNNVATVKISCSKGTYIRSIANDLGLKLGSLATLTGLIRTKIGEYILEDSSTIDKIAQHLCELRLNTKQPGSNQV